MYPAVFIYCSNIRLCVSSSGVPWFCGSVVLGPGAPGAVVSEKIATGKDDIVYRKRLTE